MKCPYCTDDMELGYIDQSRPLIPLEWYPAKREKGFLGLESSKRNVRLTYLGGSVKAYRCEKCKKIIIDESTLEEATI